MANILSLLTTNVEKQLQLNKQIEQVDQQLEDLQEQMTEEFVEQQYAPHYKHKIEGKKATRSVHFDRKKLDFDRSDRHHERLYKRKERRCID